MPEQVEIGNASVTVTPIDELSPAWSLTAAVIAGRIQMAQDDADLVAVKEAVADLVEICTEDGITARGIQGLEPGTLNTLIHAMLPANAFDDHLGESDA